ncbi:armadillo-type protein [Mycena capillaripes]|nr:armadillo-type protein [Mycena capillaripes]
MPPITRPPRFQSGHSWWSDVNPVGPTISIHAAAKPLMKFMCRKQVREFIKKNRGVPLSRSTMDIFSSYLAYKHLFPTTKILILKELDAKAVSEEEVRIILEALVEWNLLVELLESPDLMTRETSSWLLRRLVLHNLPGVGVSSLTSLLESNRDKTSRQSVSYALCTISEWPEGPRALGSIKALEWVSELLDFPDNRIRQFACTLLGNLANDEVTSTMLFNANRVLRIASLLSGQDEQVYEAALYALVSISQWTEGADQVRQLSTLPGILALTESPSAYTRGQMCDLIKHLCDNEHTITAILGLHPTEACTGIVSLLDDPNPDVRDSATHALCAISVWPGGAQVIPEMRITGHIYARLEASDAQVRAAMCYMLGNIIFHQSTQIAAMDLKLCQWMVALLSDDSMQVRSGAMYALSRISYWPDGAQHVLNTRAVEYADDMLASVDSALQINTCRLLENLAMHEATAWAVSKFNLSQRLEYLLDHPDSAVRGAAKSACRRIGPIITRFCSPGGLMVVPDQMLWAYE